jgi:hypothetical protein
MHDQKSYVNKKILDRVDWHENTEKVSNLLNELDNVDITPKSGNTFETSVIGWLTAKNMIVEMIDNDLELTVENFKKTWKPKSEPAVISRGEDVIDPELLNKPAPNIDFLLSIAECCDEDDIALLSEEGLRASGLIDRNVTSLDAHELNVEVKTVYVEPGAQIISPYTGTENIYQIDSLTYMDLENDKVFKITRHQ